MATRATTLGEYIAELMEKQQFSNRALASRADVSEGAVRNLLRYGKDTSAKDPDPRTLSKVAVALGVSPLRLFRMAGYIPPEPTAHSARAEFLAKTFDMLTNEQQDAVMSVLGAMASTISQRQAITKMRDDPANPLAGLDLDAPDLARQMANELIVRYHMTEPADVERIEAEAEVMSYTWKDLTPSTQERVTALMRHKLSLAYDPTMVDSDWR